MMTAYVPYFRPLAVILRRIQGCRRAASQEMLRVDEINKQLLA